MAGLLKMFDDPQEAGLLSAAAQMLAMSGPSRTPTGFGQVLGGGLLGGMQGMQDAEMAQFKRKYTQLQLEDLQRKADSEKALADAAKQSWISPETQSLMGGGGPTMENAAKIDGLKPMFDMEGFVNRAMAADPLKGIQFHAALAKESPFGKVDPEKFTQESVAKFAKTRNFGDLIPARKMEVGPGGQVYNPFNVQPGQVLADPNKPFSVGANGQLVPNTPYQQYEITKAGAGAARTNVSVNTEKSLLNDIAGGLGKSLVDSRGAAQAAAGTIQTLGRLNDALNSGKILAGPGATFKQYGLQVGSMLGLNGKDANETLLNTRQAIQSLSQLELDAAQQMKGQGQITEAERSILKRAAAGDIDGMTKAELGLLTGVLDKSARYKIKTYNNQVAPLKGNPNAAALSPFLDVPEPAALQSPAAMGAKIKFLGFE